MNKVCILLLLLIVSVYTGKCETGTEQRCAPVLENDVLQTNVSGLLDLKRVDITKLFLTVNNQFMTNITDLIRGSVGNRYLPVARYAVGSQLSYTIQYAQPYEYSDITVEGEKVSQINVLRSGPATYDVTFIVKGEGLVTVKAESTTAITVLGIRISN